MLDFTKLSEYGILGIVLLGIGAGLWRSIIFIANRLFDDESGLFTKFFNAHIDFVNRAQDNQVKQTEILNSMSDRLGKIEDFQSKQIEAMSRQCSILEKFQCNQKNGSV